MAITNKEIEEAEQRKREFDTKLRMHEASMGGNIRLPRKSKKETTAKEPWQPTHPLKTIDQSSTKQDPAETQEELTQKYLSMATKVMETKGVQDMMTSPVMPASFKTNPARKPESTEQNSEASPEQKPEETTKKTSKSKKTIKKDPDYSTVVPGMVRPLKFRESVADILGKMYNFMRKKYIDDSRQYKKEKKYKKKLVAIKERRIEELIHLFGGKYIRKPMKSKDESFFSKLLRYAIVGGVLFFLGSKMALASVSQKIKDTMPEIPDFMSFLGKKSAGGGPAKSLSELISRGESGGSYDIYNTGTAGVTGPPLKLSEMTVGEVMNLQKQKKVFAAGKYQITPDTLSNGVQTLEISKSEKFSPKIQEKLFTEYLIGSKRPEIQKYLNDPHPDKKTTHDYLKALSKEFAAVADPDTGKSYYDGLAKNTASITTSEALAAGEKDRSARQTELAKKQNPIPVGNVTVEQSQPTPVSIPPVSPQTNKSGTQNISMLNNNTNIINGSTNMAITSEDRNNYPPLIEKQYYTYS